MTGLVINGIKTLNINMKINAVEMTRKIRDKMYQETKGMTAEKLAGHIRKGSAAHQPRKRARR